MLSVGAWSGLTYALVGALSVALAVVVYVAAPARRRNHLLSATLATYGLFQLFFGVWSSHRWGVDLLPGRALAVLHWLAVEYATVAAVVYLLFVGVALDTRWTRWLRRRWVPVVLGVGVAGFTAAWVLFAGLTVTSEPGRFWAPSIYVGGVASVLAMLGSVAVYRRAERGSQARRSAAAFLVAFGARNLILIRNLLQATVYDATGKVLLFGPASWYTSWNFDLWQDAALDAVFLVVLSYAVLTGQLVTLDNGIKNAIKRGGVVAAVSTVFVILTEGVENWLGLESVALSVAAAVGVSFLFQPIQDLAERLATRLVPSARAVAGMGRAERGEVYHDQVTIAWEDGELLPKERRMLDRLRERLGLDAAEAEAVEDAVRPGGAGGGGKEGEGGGGVGGSGARGQTPGGVN